MSEASASNHPNVFTSIRPFSEGRAGEAWEPCDPGLMTTYDLVGEHQRFRERSYRQFQG
jgi:hypothetical protein